MSPSVLQRYFLLGSLLAALALSFFILQPFLAPLALAGVFAVVLQPIYQRLRKSLRGYRSIASLATVLVGLVILLVPVSFIATQLLIEAQQLYGSLSGGGARATVASITASIAPYAESIVPGSADRLAALTGELDTYAQSALSWLIGHLGGAFTGAAGLLLDLFIFLVALYYLLRDGGALKRRLVELSPLKNADDELVASRLEHAVNSVVKGQLTIALIQGVVSGVGYAIFGVPNAVFWGLVTAFAGLIPGVGTALILAPAVAYLAFVGAIGPAVGLAIWGSLAVGLIDNLLAPHLISSGMRLHPLLVMLSVLGGVMFFGPVGLFLGPLSVSLLLALLSLYSHMSDAAHGERVA